MDISSSILMLLLIFIALKLFKYADVLAANKANKKIEHLKTQLTVLSPNTSIVKIITNQDKNGQSIELLCINNQGKWFKVSTTEKESLELSALSMHEVVTILTKLS